MKRAFYVQVFEHPLRWQRCPECKGDSHPTLVNRQPMRVCAKCEVHFINTPAPTCYVQIEAYLIEFDAPKGTEDNPFTVIEMHAEGACETEGRYRHTVRARGGMLVCLSCGAVGTR